MWLLVTFILIWAFSPGPLTVVTLYESRKHGFKEGVGISAGAAFMCALMVLAALMIHSSGVTSVFESSSMKLIERMGALGIIGMGIFAAYKSLGIQTKEIRTEEPHSNSQIGFVKGFLMMATYIPQALVFYGLIVPQNVAPSMLIPVILSIGALKTFLMFGWHSVIALLTTRAEAWLSNNRWGTFLERSAAGLIIVLGIRILV